MPKKISPEEYREIFSKNYPDYELLSDYSGDKNYITVKCKLDGNVWKTKPNWIKQGTGCQKCYDRRRGEKTKLGKETFIKKANDVHGNKYDYFDVNYVNSKTPVSIICKKHGKFLQTPNKHLIGHGCPFCAQENNGLQKRISLEEFIKRSNEKHNNKYDYSKSIYCGWDKPITIICPKHGEFQQTAGSHLMGAGCPLCNESKLEKSIYNTLEKNGILFQQQKKFKWLGKQSLDFYLPDYNVAIECQGLQHYSDFYFNKWKYSTKEEIIRRDEIKHNLCKNNNITLYYFARERKIFDASNIYNADNTFFSFVDLVNKIKGKNLFQDIVNEVINHITYGKKDRH